MFAVKIGQRNKSLSEEEMDTRNFYFDFFVLKMGEIIIGVVLEIVREMQKLCSHVDEKKENAMHLRNVNFRT